MSDRTIDLTELSDLVLRFGDLEIEVRRVASTANPADRASLAGLRAPVGSPAASSTGVTSTAAAPEASDSDLLTATTPSALENLVLHSVADLCERLRASSFGDWTPRARVARAYRAGVAARLKLASILAAVPDSPVIPSARNHVYIVLRGKPGSSAGWAESFKTDQEPGHHGRPPWSGANDRRHDARAVRGSSSANHYVAPHPPGSHWGRSFSSRGLSSSNSRWRLYGSTSSCRRGGRVCGSGIVRRGRATDVAFHCRCRHGDKSWASAWGHYCVAGGRRMASRQLLSESSCTSRRPRSTTAAFRSWGKLLPSSEDVYSGCSRSMDLGKHGLRHSRGVWHCGGVRGWRSTRTRGCRARGAGCPEKAHGKDGSLGASRQTAARRSFVRTTTTTSHSSKWSPSWKPSLRQREHRSDEQTANVSRGGSRTTWCARTASSTNRTNCNGRRGSAGASDGCHGRGRAGASYHGKHADVAGPADEVGCSLLAADSYVEQAVPEAAGPPCSGVALGRRRPELRAFRGERVSGPGGFCEDSCRHHQVGSGGRREHPSRARVAGRPAVARLDENLCGAEDATGGFSSDDAVCVPDGSSMGSRLQKWQSRTSRMGREGPRLCGAVCHRRRKNTDGVVADWTSRTQLPVGGKEQNPLQCSTLLQDGGAKLGGCKHQLLTRHRFHGVKAENQQPAEDRCKNRLRRQAESQEGSQEEEATKPDSLSQQRSSWHLQRLAGAAEHVPLPSSSSSARRGSSPTVTSGRGTCSAAGRPEAKGIQTPSTGLDGGGVSTSWEDTIPGSTAPSEIRCLPMMEIILQICKARPGGLRAFWDRSLQATRNVDEPGRRGSDVWPCPPPLWGRWTSATKLSPKRRKRMRFLKLRAECLQAVVIVLNWLTLGHATSPPSYARAGSATSPAQDAMLDRLEEMVHHFLQMPSSQLSDIGRAGEKLGNLCKFSLQLPPKFDLSNDELHSFLREISHTFDPYGKLFSTPHTSQQQHTHTDAPPEQASTVFQQQADASAGGKRGTAVGPTGVMKMGSSTAKPVYADRIKWKLGPSFNPLPYLTDPVVKAGFIDPETLRVPPHEWPKRPAAKVHASKSELLALAKKWDDLEACFLVKCSDVAPGEHCGLFSVSKDEEYDRLILNPTVLNSRMKTSNVYTRTLAPGHMIALLRLQPSENLVLSSDDLSEFYYTFRVTEARARRNSIGIPFWGWELAGLSCYSPELHHQKVFIALRTLAMGDNLAVEVAQQAHYNVLRRHADCLRPGEVMQHRRPIPRGPCVELLTIDDHIVLQKVRNDIPLSEQDTRDKHICSQSEVAYQHVGLVAHPGKRQRQVTTAVALGTELDGVLGRVHAPRSRILLLMFVTSIVLWKGHATRRLIQCLLGAWIHVLLHRRPMFSVLEHIFHEGEGLPADQLFPLSRRGASELAELCLLGPLAQADLRAEVCPDIYVTDASPFGGAVCVASSTKFAAEELWRHSEQKGFHTKLQSVAASTLTELGLEPEEVFGGSLLETIPDSIADSASVWDAEFDDAESLGYDCLELFSGQANWTKAHVEAGFSAHPGIERSASGMRYGDLMDDHTFFGGRVKDGHGGPPCWSFGTLRRPRLRSKLLPAGFNPLDEKSLEQTRLAVRCCFLLTVALLAGSFISVEQPGSSVMFELACYQRLISLGCWITKFAFCNYGSGFNKPSKWLHNKPWLTSLGGTCQCPYRGSHFVIEGTFTRCSLEIFKRRCRPDVVSVYGREPKVGEAVSAFSAGYPLSLCRAMAAGARKFLHETGLARGSPTGEADRILRKWHDDPDWLRELCDSLQFRELFRYKFRKPGHINCLECRVFKSWLKHCAKKHPGHRIVGLLDSRVTIGAASKGRSSSPALSQILRGCLGYILGGGLYIGCHHVRSSWNRADAPSRGHDVEPATRQIPTWFSDLERGDYARFDHVIAASKWINPLGRWVRLLLLLAGDVERNPGPAVFAGYKPRGQLDLSVGLSQATARRMQTCLDEFEQWTLKEVGLQLTDVLRSAEVANLALRGYGMHLYAAGLPRYKFVYAITGVQHICPEFRLQLSGAWQIDKRWQIQEPGQCRAVLSVPMLRAAISVALLWGWFRFAGLIAVGFAGMLHPNEFISLTRQDLIFPKDALSEVPVMYIYIKNPKTARFARRQHTKVDDVSVLVLAECIFSHLDVGSPLFSGSMAVFRRQWNAVFDRLRVPRTQQLRGATPGTLRGSGATAMYLECENIPKIAWRGRWSKTQTLEYYIQEVGAQLFLHTLPKAVKETILFLDQHCGTVVHFMLPDSRRLAEQYHRSGKGGST
eukprot:Skav235748  [mRNA]  locus=scaffold803:24495:31367:+ [translate_table: standard]